jgi:hypothetical protein
MVLHPPHSEGWEPQISPTKLPRVEGRKIIHLAAGDEIVSQKEYKFPLKKGGRQASAVMGPSTDR